MSTRIKDNLEKLQALYDSGLSWNQISVNQNISRSGISHYVKLGLLKSRSQSDSIKLFFIKNPKPPMNLDTKQKISETRKKWLRENPDKHPWRKPNNFNSKPCQAVKNFLKSKNIHYIEEYQPNVCDRNFSLDIAFPEKMFCIEINGNQHYNSNGSLKPYYQERHDLLTENGWRVMEVHHSLAWNFNFLQELYLIVLNIENIYTFDYSKYTNDISIIKNKNSLCDCGKPKHYRSKNCRKCISKSHCRKVDRPSKDELEKLIWEKTFTELGENFGVSDKTIKDWCKFYDITNFPPRGFWLKSSHSSIRTKTTIRLQRSGHYQLC